MVLSNVVKVINKTDIYLYLEIDLNERSITIYMRIQVILPFEGEANVLEYASVCKQCTHVKGWQNTYASHSLLEVHTFILLSISNCHSLGCENVSK